MLWVRDSLRANLIGRLVSALALIGVIAVVAAYVLGSRYANLDYDRALSDDVVTLSGQIEVNDEGRVHVNLPASARKWLLANAGERVVYRVIDLRSGDVIESNGSLGAWSVDMERAGIARFRDAEVDGVKFRVGFLMQPIAQSDTGVLVEVGETLGRRQRMTHQILGSSLLLFGTMIGVAATLVWKGVNSALNPLQVLESAAATRSGANLTPLDTAFAPVEVRGLIRAINRMMERLSESIEAQSRFIANAAHQLRTPIAGLHLQAQLALEEESSPSVHARVGEIDRSARRAAHLIEQLLTLSRAESGAIVASGTPVDLGHTALEVIERALPSAIERDIDLGYDGVEEGAAQGAIVTGNAVLLAELLFNLVDNAIRYGRRGGRITVSLARDGAKVVLRVADDGPGLPPAKQAELFRRFHRPDSATGTGAGLGLSIVKEIAERHSATLQCRSEPGQGVEMTVEFLAANVAPAAA